MKGLSTPRRFIFVRKVSSFLGRTLIAVFIFGLICWGVQWGKGPQAFLKDGLEYLLAKNYDLSLLMDRVGQALRGAQGLEVKVSGPLQDVKDDFSGYPDLPVTGQLVQGFGWQEGKDGWPHFNEGIELAVSKGALVRAVWTGKVIRVEQNPDYGFTVVIRHNDQKSTLYGRLGETGVKVGDSVVQGQVIGTVQSGLFHFEVRKGDQLVDPILNLQQVN